MASKFERNPSKAAPATGRIATSEYLKASTTTTQSQRLGPGASTEKKPPKLLSATSTTSLQIPHEASTTGKPLRTPSNSRGLQAGATVSTRRTSVKSNASSTKLTPSATSSNARAPPPSLPPPPIQEHVPTRTSDPLQVAAQIYPWMHMTSTLEACFQSAEASAHSALERCAKELSEEETDLADRRIRFETERLVAFYDELSTSKFATEAPSTMQSFLEHGDACTHLNAEALRLAAHGPNQVNHSPPIQRHNDVLAKLENLQAQATQLESSILLMTESPPDPHSQSGSCSQILSVFSACLAVLRSRMANLLTAHELVRVSKENLSMSLQVESMRLSA